MKTRGLFAGSFDPFHCGHAEVVVKALTLFSEVYIFVAENESKKKVISEANRLKNISQWILEQKLGDRVFVESGSDLTVEKAKKLGCSALIRGIRNANDVSYELELAECNRLLEPSIESIFFLASPAYRALSSSFVRELLKRGHSVDEYLPTKVIIDRES